jgi:immune inhibitor A
MSRHSLDRVVLGVLLGLLALGASGPLFEAGAMPPYLDESGKPHSPSMAAAIDRYNELRASFAERGIDTPGGGLAAGAQVVGNFNILAICADHPDKVATVSPLEFDTLIFHNGPGSVRDLYNEMSYGQLTITTVNLPSSLGWKRLSTNYSYYVNNNYGLGGYPQNTQKLCEDLVDLVDPLVNFAQYDNDGNGWVDGIVIVHPGRGAEFSGSTSDIWSHKWGISPRTKDGVRVSAYSIQPEYWTNPGDITIGVYAHEIGHLFGLPDLYDTDGSSRGVGRWSLMSSGSWNGSLGNSPAHMDAWCKIELGWITPTNVAANMTGAIIPRVIDNPTVFRLWEDGAIESQYFLLENRQKVGYDTYLPGAGLLIWHIDDSKTNNNNEWYPGHTASGNFWVALEQADGGWDMEKNLDQGDAGDPFPGSTNKTTFSSASTPSSDDYAGGQTYVTVTNISPSGSTMTCDFQVSLVSDVFDGGGDVPDEYRLAVSNSPNPFNAATTVEFTTAGADRATLHVYDVLGRRVITLLDGAVAPGTQRLTWNGENEHGQPVASGVYFARFESKSDQVTRKMVLLR